MARIAITLSQFDAQKIDAKFDDGDTGNGVISLDSTVTTTDPSQAAYIIDTGLTGFSKFKTGTLGYVANLIACAGGSLDASKPRNANLMQLKSVLETTDTVPQIISQSHKFTVLGGGDADLNQIPLAWVKLYIDAMMNARQGSFDMNVYAILDAASHEDEPSGNTLSYSTLQRLYASDSTTQETYDTILQHFALRTHYSQSLVTLGDRQFGIDLFIDSVSRHVAVQLINIFTQEKSELITTSERDDNHPDLASAQNIGLSESDVRLILNALCDQLKVDPSTTEYADVLEQQIPVRTNQ